MSERRTLRTRGEVIEEYSRDFPAEIVETYSRPLPGAEAELQPVSKPQKKKRRFLRGAALLLAVAAVVSLTAGGIRYFFWQWQAPDDNWHENDYYYYDREQDEEETPITIPTVRADPDARLTLAELPGYERSASEVYQTVHSAVVTVAVNLDNGRMSIGTGVIFQADGYLLTNHHVVSGGHRLHGAAGRRYSLRGQICCQRRRTRPGCAENRGGKLPHGGIPGF